MIGRVSDRFAGGAILTTLSTGRTMLARERESLRRRPWRRSRSGEVRSSCSSTPRSGLDLRGKRLSLLKLGECLERGLGNIIERMIRKIRHVGGNHYVGEGKESTEGIVL